MSGPAIGAYIAPGKRAFRQLLFDLALRDGVTSYATFWGHGIDSRMFAPHFDVVATEIREAKHAAMVADGLAHSYRTHTGRGATLPENVDMFHADFDGPPSQTSFDELRRIATKTNKWLAVTLSNGHKLDPSVQGEAASYTIPAWLTGASGFTLEYLARYASTGGQTMWVAILQRREGKGNSHRVQPLQVARSIGIRGYWASLPMLRTGLMPHTAQPYSEATRTRQLAYYQENRDRKLELAREGAKRRRKVPEKRAADLARTASWRKSDRGRKWMSDYHKQRMADPEYAERYRTYHREWKRARKAAVSGTAAEAISMTPETPKLAA